MGKAFISILGTNDYLECKHEIDGKIISPRAVKYVQEDLIRFFCLNWEKDSEIRIFLTDEAEEKNWLDNGQSKTSNNKGLFTRLKEMGLKAKITPIKIPQGNNEEELWEIFDILYNSFGKNEEVIVDITHSFRSLPMILTVMLNYTRQIKNIKVKGIYYAAFETLGTISEVKKILPSERIAPIIDLTQLIKLQEWTIATFDFVSYANVSYLKKLVKNELKTISLERDPLKKNEILLRNTVIKLNEISKNIALCRGNEIIDFDYDSLRNNLETIKNSDLVIKPVKNLIEIIRDKISGFNNNQINNGLLAVEWCLNHNLYQQAITILQEILITKVLASSELDYQNLKFREIASSAIKIKSAKIPREKWKGEASKNKELTQKLLEIPLVEKIKSPFEKLTDLRNDVNHAGFLSKHKKFSSITQRLQNVYVNIKNIFQD